MKGILRPVLMVLGSISILLGIVGIVLPLFPTTPFLLLAAFCYGKSSEKLHNWLLNTKWLGEYIKNFQSGKGIPVRAKYVLIISLWLSSCYSIFFVIPLLWVKGVMILLVCYITYFIWSIKSPKRD